MEDADPVGGARERQHVEVVAAVFPHGSPLGMTRTGGHAVRRPSEQVAELASHDRGGPNRSMAVSSMITSSSRVMPSRLLARSSARSRAGQSYRCVSRRCTKIHRVKPRRGSRMTKRNGQLRVSRLFSKP